MPLRKSRTHYKQKTEVFFANSQKHSLADVVQLRFIKILQISHEKPMLESLF